MAQAGNSSGQAARPLPAGADGECAPGWQIAAIFLLTFLAYLPALHGGLLWDDDRHVTKLALRTWAGLERIWCEVGATQQYYRWRTALFGSSTGCGGMRRWGII